MKYRGLSSYFFFFCFLLVFFVQLFISGSADLQQQKNKPRLSLVANANIKGLIFVLLREQAKIYSDFLCFFFIYFVHKFLLLFLDEGERVKSLTSNIRLYIFLYRVPRYPKVFHDV
jgi:hypothetical protein